MHRCAATCCDNKEYSIEKVNACVENCASKLNSAQSLLQKEFGESYDRYQRCLLICNDDVTMELKSDHPSQAEVRRGIIKNVLIIYLFSDYKIYCKVRSLFKEMR